VLLQHQSSEEFLARARDSSVCVVVSVSPQSRAALASRLGCSLGEAARTLHALLTRLGARCVFDTAVSRELSLLETAAELVERLRTAGPLPLLASACPGWVCYAEKSCGEAVLRHLSAVKSPQAVMGTLVKRLWAPRHGVEARSLYHATVMPCYDKKLEASREDFVLEGSGGVAETDCVLTTEEVWSELMALREGGGQGEVGEIDATDAMDAELPAGDVEWTALDAEGRPYNSPGGGSGGYADAAARGAALALWGVQLPPDAALPWAQLRNADFLTLHLHPPPHLPAARPLRFAAVYGFRNIQTVVRQIKKGACEFDYVEVMACPGGCLNGGGQGAPPAGLSPQQALAQAQQLYAQGGAVQPGGHPLVAQVYDWLGGAVGSDAAKAALHTRFHVRQKTVSAVLNNW